MPDRNHAQSESRPPSGEARTYWVKHVFQTVQGEGFWSGRPAVFVRLVGCNMWSGYEADRERDAEQSGADCPLWCDTDFTKEGATDYTAEDLASRMREVRGAIDFCVLTGGEPFLQADAGLVRTLHDAGYEVAVETNGTIPIQTAFQDDDGGAVYAPDWVTCSPKLPEDELRLERFDELKLIVPDYRPEDYEAFLDKATPHTINGRSRQLLWLQPEAGPRLEAAKACAVSLALQYPRWRVSTQTHKTLGIE